jgi:hypothetical protein
VFDIEVSGGLTPSTFAACGAVSIRCWSLSWYVTAAAQLTKHSRRPQSPLLTAVKGSDGTHQRYVLVAFCHGDMQDLIPKRDHTYKMKKRVEESS